MSASVASRGTLAAAVLLGIFLAGAGFWLAVTPGEVFPDDVDLLRTLERSAPGEALALQEDPDDARPVANIVRFALLRATGAPESIRVAAAILHGLAAVCLFLLARSLLTAAGGLGEGVTLLAPAGAAILFAVHPLASEALLAPAGFPMVLGLAIVAGAMLLAARARAAGSAPRPFAPASLLLAGLLCDPSLWPAGLVVAALDRRGTEPGPPRSMLRAVGPYAASIGLFYLVWAARRWPEFHALPLRRPWPIVSGIAAQSAAFLSELRLIAAPWWGLAIDHTDVAYAGGWGTAAIAGAVLLAALLGAAVLALRSATLLRIGVGLFGLLHLSLVLSPPEYPLQERRLYAGLAGAALVAAALLRAIERRAGARAALAVAALAAAALGLASARQMRVWESPIVIWEAAARVSPGSARPHLALANLHLARGDQDAALAAFEDALARAPRNAAIQNSIAEIYLAKGDYPRAAAEARKAMEIDARFLPAYITAGNSFMLRDQTREAFIAFNEALRIDSEDPIALYNMGALLYQQKRFAKAAELLHLASLKRPKDAEILFRLGMSQLNSGDMSGAADSLRGCLGIAEERADCRVNLASILTQLRHHEEARQLLEAVLATEPGHAKALNGLGVLASARNQWEAAASYYQRAFDADPADLRTLYNLAGAYEHLGDTHRAIEGYRKVADEWTGAMDVSEAARARLAQLEGRARGAAAAAPAR